MTEFQVRTDLALEARERFEEDVEIRGVEVEEAYDEQRDIRVTVVRIRTENGAKAMGKPIGTYITLEAPRMSEPDEDYHREVSEKLAGYLKKLLDVKNEKSVLVVGLGNREVTPDALGPEAVNHLRVTRHVVREYGKAAFAREKVQLVSTIVPGVMAQTGMETLEIVRGIVAETKPDQVVVIDALAARSSKRLNRTIQISDAGIQPGSGVGNHRNSLTRETIGIPVLAIGVPTVVDAATIVYDATGDRSSVPPGLNGMFVTPKNVDEMIRRLSFTISEALNLALS
ncbi:GPR endopeptidase [Laedolimicola ammoniilytica]|uniref:Germination protease n=1 Tax=Laedolimicola ammoniilytica TaxID=2981771 RepID=A0ABT2RYH7_9FIRM|nr:GPR endopeptidase [Laedolimicola ammoniilytica]MCC2825549.1 GPR endopeptidase [Faecalicatena orotica]MCU6697384.1 GPR endopeptidase [Laedolimicola ammoniilytica]SCG91605.1 Germination protease precursor [uncultured Clostridium sp.]SCI23753.1 Germination protease precursor [uncultured Clostridium sp.]